jgi:hypothetical protein
MAVTAAQPGHPRRQTHSLVCPQVMMVELMEEMVR